jgi:Holliday junction resolvase RusA-like endonuclease
MKIYTLPGTPIPQPRARILRNGIHYDPAHKDKEQTRFELLTQRNQFKSHMLTCPTLLQVTFFMPIPNSISKKKQSLLMGQPHSKKPDIDNLLKYTLDCCKNILFLDDSQVFAINSRKIYDSNPRTEFFFGADNEEKVNP